MTTLGICIPTYKRPDFLIRCVLSALEAAGDRPIRIFIADDSMDDTNDAAYAKLAQWSNQIVIHRNARNLGIDDNIQQAVDLCDCDYAWIVGEDDSFMSDSVRRVHDALQGATHAFVFANYAYVGDDDNRRLGQALDVPDGEMPGFEFVSKYLWAAGFIGACIVDRKRWDATSTAPYKGSYYTHVGRICELLAGTGEVLPARIIAEPCVANRVEGTDTFTWKRDSYGVFFGFCAMCNAVTRQCPSLSGASMQAAKVMENRYGWLTLRLAMRLRSERGYDVEQYRRYLSRHTENGLKRFAFYVISISPPWAFQPLVSAYRRMRRGAA
ncbi:glycosyltransferase family 2 protein [Pandoraea sp. PE-S2T-3]|uniref:glycosyltransferase family 2 protein n=1 Tax=Pandoraea sp. PE-S2T-3 TaxID=1986993 RepID=UPI001595DD2B|nr:glycosyltransferase [Pandoraea sp. PE-S2T-3]